MLKKLFSAAAIYAVAPQLPKLVSFFMLPILTKHLTSEDYGVSGIVMAYVAAFSAFKDVGLGVELTNSFFKYPNRYLFTWQRIHGLIQIWSILYGLFLVPLIYLITPGIAKNNVLWIILFIVIPIIVFEPVSTIGRQYYQLNKQPVSFSIIAVSASLTAILVNYITIVVFKLGYLGFFISSTAAGLISFLIYSYLIYFKIKIRPLLQFNLKWVKKKISKSFPTIPHFYAGYLLNMGDRVLLDLYKIPINEIGLYSFAYSIGTYFGIIGKSYWAASGPFYMEFYKQEDKDGDLRARNLTYLFQILMVAVAFVICIWAKELFDFIARNEYLKSSYLIAIIIIMSYTYHPSYSYNGMKIWYTEKTKLLLKISFGAALISLFINIFLIPIIGIYGSALATFVSMMFMGFGGYFYKDIQALFKVRFHVAFWLSLIILFTVLAYLLNSANIYIKSVITLTLMALSVLSYTNRIVLISLINKHQLKS